MQKVFYIPKKDNIVVVSDLFSEDYTGGAELTLDAILQKSPERYFKLHSSSLTPELVEKNKSKYWIIANFANADPNAMAELVRSKVKFTVLEFDYKYCKYRSSHLHKLQEGRQCDCNKSRSGRFVRALYSKAHWVMYMSQLQLEEYQKLFPEFPADNFLVQSSTFSDETLLNLSNLRQKRLKGEIKDSYAVLHGGSWIKAQQETEEWCKKSDVKYELIGGMPYKEFINELSKYKGLVFRPAGYDTCPRITIEAKLLGMECILNENVQHKNEAWFSGSIEQCEEYLRTRAQFFWDKVYE